MLRLLLWHAHAVQSTACLIPFVIVSVYSFGVELEVCTFADMRDPETGLLGNTLHTDNADWLRKDSGIGAGIDSFYEYLLKVATAHDEGSANLCFATIKSHLLAFDFRLHLSQHHFQHWLSVNA